MLGTQLARFFHATCCSLSATSKSHLAELRKKTGYTFANCKKALEENNNDLAKAEQWLHEQAQAMGWAKAGKLQGRTASQGLIGIAVDKSHAVLVEVNCETDFVAKNETFKSFVELVTDSCLQVSKKQKNDSNEISKTLLESVQLKEVTGPDGKSLADHSALTIGAVGENLILTRALCLAVGGDLKIGGFAHPAQKTTQPYLGKYGAVVVLKSESDEETVEKAAKQLSQHIIGMNPTRVGNPETDKPKEDSDDEKNLIFQEFLIDSELTVKEYLDENKVEVVDFVRFELCEEPKNENTVEQKSVEQRG